MRIAILSDIHANREAFEACLTDAARQGAQRFVLLGDLVGYGADPGWVLSRAQEMAAQGAVLIRGNHDDHAGDPPPAWGIDVVTEPHPLPPFLACHLPVEPRTGYALCGHIHPGVWLSGAGEAPARLPCFVVGPRRAILPAFGRFTGLAMIRPEAGETRVAIAGSRLFPLPPG